jgi:integral membrane sensor domain MASE1
VIKKLLDFRSPKNIAFLAFLTIIYFVAARLGLRLALVQPYATPIWFPVGGALAAFILFGYRVWPAVLIGSFLGHVTKLGFVSTSFAIPVGATLEGLAGAYLVNKFAHGVKAFDTAKGVFLFVLFTCICAPSIDVALGIAMDFFGGRSNLANFAFNWLTWWLAHGIGVLLVAPFLILLFRDSHHRLDGREIGELLILLLGLTFVCLLVFGPFIHSLNKSGFVRVWLCIPFLIWAGFRFCQLEAAGTTLILFGSAIWGTLHGYGYFVEKDLTTSLVLLDTFIGVIGTMTLVVAAMVVERRRIEEELLGTQSLLQDVLEGKDRELIVTLRALEVETAAHVQARRELRESQEQLRLLAENTKLAEKPQGIRSHPERVE